MRPEAIVYISNTGYTARYAQLLGQKTGLPVHGLSDKGAQPGAGTPVLYLGWLMAGQIKGYQKAARRYTVCAVCGVGMGAPNGQLEEVRKANSLPPELPAFTLQGGFDRTRLRCVYRLMMDIMAKTVGKSLADKRDRTPEEDDMLELMAHGGSRVSEEQLLPVLDWYQKTAV